MQDPETLEDETDELSERMDRALMESAQLCFWRHKRLLEPIVVFRDGKVVTVPPEDIELDPTVIDPDTGKLR
ncbi:MAG TPA: hypothetical protein VHR72_07980 [Gemmataceae bacterium]|jgi:hypothetical protein|nr:hypothetical protein [Gemmataceae bacterium]